MEITKKQIDSLNAVLTVTIEKKDFSENVEKALNNYRKTANIPGFRKGFVPMGLVKKQYGRAVQVDEVNKILQQSVHKFLTDEKLNILGNPLPVENTIDWDADTLSFDFELGLAPEFQIDLKPKKGIRQFNITVDKKVIDNQIDRIQTQFGKLVTETKVGKESEVRGTFFNQENNINKTSSFSVEILSPEALKEFKGKKVGDQININTKTLFKDAHDLMHQLGVAHQDAHNLDIDVTFTFEEVNKREKAELNQELFDKLFPAGEVTSEEALRNKISENAQEQYNQQADQQLLNDVTDYLLESTSFELPAEFLKKWLRTAGEKVLTQEEANTEYEKSEKGLRYQLIEGKIITENNLQVTFEELKDFAKNYIRQQMLQFGMTPDDVQVEDIVKRVLQNREEVERLTQQLTSQKLITFYKENVSLNKKDISYDDFIKEVYN